MKGRDLLFIKDILDAIDRVQEFVEGMDYGAFAADDKTMSAVLRKIEIIGEAAKNVPEAVRGKYGAVPWSRLAKMRDRLIRKYFTVDEEIIWKAAKEELPELRGEIAKIYESESRKG